MGPAKRMRTDRHRSRGRWEVSLSRRSIAVIGGGAAGLTTAYLLAKSHDVTVFEATGHLGGHVRTVGTQIPCKRVKPGVHLESGVIEFELNSFPTWHALMRELDVELATVPVTTALYFPKAHPLRSPQNIAFTHHSMLWKIAESVQMLPMVAARAAWLTRVASLSEEELYERSLGDSLGNTRFAVWVRTLLVYAWSVPYPNTLDLPAVMAVPLMHHFLWGEQHWVRIVGGVYTYIERMLERGVGQVRLNTPVRSVTRENDGVTLEIEGETLRFDEVVFATSPNLVLPLLTDPSQAEQRRFQAWQGHNITTLLHTDTGLHDRYHIDYPSEFDLFVLDDKTAGYNAFLDRLCGENPDREPKYSLSLYLDDEIDPNRVLHRQDHHAPLFSQKALYHRREVLKNNGENRTWHAGAWCHDGLHEGAIRSAQAVSTGLGGATLDVEA